MNRKSVSTLKVFLSVTIVSIVILSLGLLVHADELSGARQQGTGEGESSAAMGRASMPGDPQTSTEGPDLESSQVAPNAAAAGRARLNEDFVVYSDPEGSTDDLVPAEPNLEPQQGIADLRVIKMNKPDTEVQTGSQFTYTILVDNLGPDTAHNIVITDTLITEGVVDPNGCSIAVRTSGGAIDEFTCEFAASSGVFDLGTFGSNHLHPRSPFDMGRIIVTVNATSDRPGDVNNVVTVVSETHDPDTSNNLSTDTLTIVERGLAIENLFLPLILSRETAWSVGLATFGLSGAVSWVSWFVRKKKGG